MSSQLSTHSVPHSVTKEPAVCLPSGTAAALSCPQHAREMQCGFHPELHTAATVRHKWGGIPANSPCRGREVIAGGAEPQAAGLCSSVPTDFTQGTQIQR